MKNFLIKVYRRNEYIGRIKDFSFDGFSKVINSGLGECRVVLFNPESKFIRITNRYDIFVKDKDSKKGELLYRGEVNSVIPVKSEENQVEVVLYGIVHKLGRIYFEKVSDYGTEQEIENATILKQYGQEYIEPRVQTDGERLYMFLKKAQDANYVSTLYLVSDLIGGGDYTETELVQNVDYPTNLNLSLDTKARYSFIAGDSTTEHFQVNVAYSNKDGSNFVRKVMTNYTDGDVKYLAMTSDGSNLYFMWVKDGGSSQGLYFGTCDVEGNNWRSELVLSDSIGVPAISSMEPISIEVSRGNLHFIYSFSNDDVPAIKVGYGTVDVSGFHLHSTEIIYQCEGGEMPGCTNLKILEDKIVYAFDLFTGTQYKVMKVVYPIGRRGPIVFFNSSNFQFVNKNDLNSYIYPETYYSVDFFRNKTSTQVVVKNDNIYLMCFDGPNIVIEAFNTNTLKTEAIKLSYFNINDIKTLYGFGFCVSGDRIYMVWYMGGLVKGERDVDMPKTTTITYLDTAPEDMLKDIIDEYNGSVMPELSTITRYTDKACSYTFKQMTYLDCINQIKELCGEGWYWYVNAKGQVILKHYSDFVGMFPRAW